MRKRAVFVVFLWLAVILTACGTTGGEKKDENGGVAADAAERGFFVHHASATWAEVSFGPECVGILTYDSGEVKLKVFIPGLGGRAGSPSARYYYGGQATVEHLKKDPAFAGCFR